jgi:hypothetical protein
MVSGIPALLYHSHCIETGVRVFGAFTFLITGGAPLLHVSLSSLRLPYGLLCWLQIAHLIPQFPYLIGYVFGQGATLFRICLSILTRF